MTSWTDLNAFSLSNVEQNDSCDTFRIVWLSFKVVDVFRKLALVLHNLLDQPKVGNGLAALLFEISPSSKGGFERIITPGSILEFCGGVCDKHHALLFQLPSGFLWFCFVSSSDTISSNVQEQVGQDGNSRSKVCPVAFNNLSDYQ